MSREVIGQIQSGATPLYSDGALHTVRRFTSYPGNANHRRIANLTNTRQAVHWPVGIAAVRLRAFGTSGDRIKVVFDAPNDAVADAWLVDTAGPTLTVMYQELIVGEDWQVYEFIKPGIIRLDAIGTANANELWIEAYEMEH